MNTVQTAQEKRSIKVKDFLDDFRSGSYDAELMEKYHLTPAGLEKFLTMLAERKILSPEEIQEHREREAALKEEIRIDDSSFICPNCLASHQVLTDRCSECGISFLQGALEETELAATPEDLEKKQEAEQNLTLSEHPGEFCFDVQNSNPSAKTQPSVELASSPFKAEPDDFVGREDFAPFQSGFEDSPDEVVPGTPLDYLQSPEGAFLKSEVRCESCADAMQSGIRDVYERTYAKKALFLAAFFAVLGFLGTFILGFFTTPSFARLVVFYATGAFVIAGTILAAVGTFLFFARETVYFCPSCKRVYPKG